MCKTAFLFLFFNGYILIILLQESDLRGNDLGRGCLELNRSYNTCLSHTRLLNNHPGGLSSLPSSLIPAFITALLSCLRTLKQALPCPPPYATRLHCCHHFPKQRPLLDTLLRYIVTLPLVLLWQLPPRGRPAVPRRLACAEHLRALLWQRSSTTSMLPALLLCAIPCSFLYTSSHIFGLRATNPTTCATPPNLLSTREQPPPMLQGSLPHAISPPVPTPKSELLSCGRLMQDEGSKPSHPINETLRLVDGAVSPICNGV